jgi:hypothetical protein
VKSTEGRKPASFPTFCRIDWEHHGALSAKPEIVSLAAPVAAIRSADESSDYGVSNPVSSNKMAGIHKKLASRQCGIRSITATSA